MKRSLKESVGRYALILRDSYFGVGFERVDCATLLVLRMLNAALLPRTHRAVVAGTGLLAIKVRLRVQMWGLRLRRQGCDSNITSIFNLQNWASVVHVLWRGNLAQRIRLASGLVLFAFAATHFLNQALALISLNAMLAFDTLRIAVTRSWAGTAILTAALLVHVGMARPGSPGAARCVCPCGNWSS